MISRCSGRKVTYQPRYWIDNKNGSISKNFILKHSFNIEDLLETGDFATFLCGDMLVKKLINEYDICELKSKHYHLVSIITKEQLTNIEYKVGD